MRASDTNHTNKFQRTEVGKMEWNSFEDSLQKIRIYNLEKKRVLTNIYETIQNFPLLYFNDM